jgi:glycerophosphoryl diester phosphodiesterase
MHDATLDRTTTGIGRVRESTLRELQATRLLDAEGWPTNWAVPTLAEVARSFGAAARLLVEVKTDDAPAPATRGRDLALELRALRPKHLPTVLSFTAEALISARNAWCDLETYLLLNLESPASAEDVGLAVIAGKAAGATGVGVTATAVSADLVTQAHRASLAVYSWGNSSRDLIASGLTAGVDLMASDDPGMLLREVQARGV